MKVKIDIDTRTFVRFGLVALAFVTGILAIYYSRHALILIGVSLFLALALNPPVNWLAKHLPGKKQGRASATAVAYLAVLILLGAVVFLIVPPVIEQSSKFANTVPSLIDQATQQKDVFNNFITKYNLQDQVNHAIDNAKNQASSVAAHIGEILVNGVSTTLNGLLNVLFILVLTFLMLIEGPLWLKRIWGLYQDPVRLERHRNLVQRMYRVVTGYVNGQMIVAAVAATCTLVVILILSAIFPMPANLAIPLAVLVFIGGLVPMIGATISAILVAIILALNAFPAAVVFLIYILVYKQIENNFISPVIQSRAVELSALAILTSILIGVTMLGLLGGLIAIPIAGCIRVLVIDRLEHDRKVREKKSLNPFKKSASKKEAA
jgi:predicted PurR-regulated permease PerM